jgi:hypothetical protein
MAVLYEGNKLKVMIIAATANQKRDIHMNVPKDIKEEVIQWATNDNAKISCNDLSFDQANEVLSRFGRKPHKLNFWAKFDKKNERHKYILSLCIQYGWWKKSGKYNRIADLDKLNAWMHSDRNPVKKALEDMESKELSKFIIALEGMTKSKK